MAKKPQRKAAEWIETFKGAVLASEYDPETYMNVGQGMCRLMVELLKAK